MVQTVFTTEKRQFYIAEKDSVEDNFSFIKDNYFQGQLRKLDDDKLKGPWFNYISSMPKEFFTMENLTYDDLTEVLDNVRYDGRKRNIISDCPFCGKSQKFGVSLAKDGNPWNC